MGKLTNNSAPKILQPPVQRDLLSGPKSDPKKLTYEEALALRSQLQSFEEDWEAPGMEAYDEL